MDVALFFNPSTMQKPAFKNRFQYIIPFLLIGVFLISCGNDDGESDQETDPYDLTYMVDFEKGNFSSWTITYTDAQFTQQTLIDEELPWTLQLTGVDIEENYELEVVIEAEPSDEIEVACRIAISRADVIGTVKSDSRSIADLSQPQILTLRVQSL